MFPNVVFRDAPVSDPSESLVGKILNRFSTYNMAFGVNEEGYPRTISSRANLYDNDKLYKLNEEFNHPTHRLEENGLPTWKRYLSSGLSLMYDAMDVKKYFRKYRFVFDPNDYHTKVRVKGKSSSGINMVQPQSYQCYGIKYTMGRTGTKHEYTEMCQGIIVRAYHSETHELPSRDACNVIGKQDIYNDWECSTKAQREKMRLKMRHFFIVHTFTNTVASLTSILRHGFERGKVIRIGMKWWNGGALYVAKLLKYDSPDQCFGMGDFTKIDKHIKRQFLQIYSSESLRYMKEYDPFFMALHKYTAESLAVKIVHLVAGKWVVMDGVMPSGHYDTSHGDSWIVSLCYYMLVASSLDGPNRVAVRKALAAGLIAIIVYGDDHVISVPRPLIDVLGETAFSHFCKKQGLFIRDIQNDVPFFSTIGPFGELAVSGVSFLQRYFIRKDQIQSDVHQDLPEVLPFRPAHKNIVKVAYGCGSERTLLDIILSLLGHMYDTMGTNLYAYEFLVFVYRRIIREAMDVHADPQKELQQYISQGNGQTLDMQRFVRKLGISVNDLTHIPALSHLQLKHTYTHLDSEHDITKDFSDEGSFFYQ